MLMQSSRSCRKGFGKIPTEPHPRNKMPYCSAAQLNIYSDRKRPGNHLSSPPAKQEILICPSFALSDQTDSSKSTFLLPSSPPVGASLQAPYILESVGRARSLPFGLESQFGFSERRSRPSKELAKLGPVRPKPLCTTTVLPVPT